MASNQERRWDRWPGIAERNGVLYYWITDETGRRRRINLGKIRPREAYQVRLEHQARIARLKAGVTDRSDERRRELGLRPLEEHLTNYREDLVRTKPDRDRTYLDAVTIGYVRRFLEFSKAVTINSLDPERANAFLTDLARTHAPSTVEHARKAIVAFSRWAQRTGRTERELIPSYSVAGVRVNEAELRRKPRALSVGELDRLLGVAPPGRRAQYLLRARVGLRGRELLRILWRDVNLVEETIRLGADVSRKDEREHVLSLPPSVVDALREIMPAPIRLDAPIFSSTPDRRTWIRDLVAARIVELKDHTRPFVTRYRRDNLIGYEDDRGRKVDPKCLRMTFNHHLEAEGVATSIRMVAMRHKDPKLTAGTYADVDVDRLRSAVGSLEGR